MRELDKYDMLEMVDIITSIQHAEELECFCDHDDSFVCDRCEGRVASAEELLSLIQRAKGAK